MKKIHVILRKLTRINRKDLYDKKLIIRNVDMYKKYKECVSTKVFPAMKKCNG